MNILHKLTTGQAAPKGATVYLCHGYGDQRRELEYFKPEDDWRCPEAVNGHWYGWTTDAETESYMREQGFPV